jgi:ABC-type antimicrobial peptide transport system permease subunit
MRMHFGENSRMALETVRDHKTRSFLTVLGVVIGVAAMIFVASILVGVSRDIQGYPGGLRHQHALRLPLGLRHPHRTHERRRTQSQAAYLDDAKAILAECPHVKSVTVEVMPRINPDEQRPPLRVARYGTHEITDLDYSGADSAYQDVYNATRQPGPVLQRL